MGRKRKLKPGWAKCAECGRLFHRSNEHAGNQKTCSEGCRRKRRDKQQNKWYKRKYRKDKEFSERAKKRCKESNRKRRREQRQAPVAALLPETSPLPAVAGIPVQVDDLMRGLVAMLSKARTQSEVDAEMVHIADNGRRLAFFSCSG